MKAAAIYILAVFMLAKPVLAKRLFRVSGHRGFARLGNGSSLVAADVRPADSLEELEDGWVNVEEAVPWHLDVLDGKMDWIKPPTGAGRGWHLWVVDTGVDRSHSEFEGADLGSSVGVEDPWKDCVGHGTAVASLAVGRTLGVATEATLHSVRAFAECQRTAPISQIARAVGLIPLGNRTIINMSFSGPANSLLDELVAQLVRDGAVVVVSAGNDLQNSCELSPARVPSATTVSGFDRSGWDTFNWGKCVDARAPASEVSVAALDGGFRVGFGTSFAAPIVSGAVAHSNGHLRLDPKSKRVLLLPCLSWRARKQKVLLQNGSYLRFTERELYYRRQLLARGVSGKRVRIRGGLLEIRRRSRFTLIVDLATDLQLPQRGLVGLREC